MSGDIRVGVLGAGWGAGLHLEGYRRAGGVELAAIWSRTRERAERRASEYGIPRVAGTLEELIDAVDVVSVATPPAAHHGPVLAAAAAGRHVLCDKPVALTGEQASDMLAAVRAAGVRHATGFIWRADPSLVRMRELLRAGAVGTVLEVHTTCALGVPELPMTWMYDDSAGGGALAQHGSHVIDRARWVVGAEIVRVAGRLSHDVKEAAVIGPVHDVTDAFAWAREQRGRRHEGPRGPVTADTGYDFMAVFDNGVRARCWEAWHLCGPAEDHLVVFGEEGTLEWRGAGGLVLHRVGRDPEPMAAAGSAGSGAGTPREVGLRRWAELASRFVESARTGRDTGHPTLVDGWWVAAVSDAVRRSHAEGGWQDVR